MDARLTDIHAAARVLEGVSIRTPMEHSRWLSEAVGGPVLLKCENLQRTGSFKIRGAYVRLARLAERGQSPSVVAASAGNHAQGVALAARLLGLRATVFMPTGAPIPKLNATLGYGAEVRLEGDHLTETLAAARGYADRHGAEFIHPFDHADILAGQGTAGLEVLEQAPEAQTVLVPVGGGGLIAGMATAIKALRPEVRIIGVQAEGAAAFPPSLAHGHPLALDSMATMADGIAVACPGDLTFAAVRDHVDEVITVPEDSISRALVMLLERAKMVTEPSGAVGVAALLDRPEYVTTPTVVVLSGGNVDPLLLGNLIRHGLAAGGRYLSLSLRIPDHPGGLAQLLTELAALGANVVEVSHDRISPALGVDEVQVRVQVETRGREHADTVLAALTEQGYRVVDQPS